MRSVGLRASLLTLGLIATAIAGTVCPPASEHSLDEACKTVDAGEWAKAELLITPLLASFPDCARAIAAQGRLELARRNYDGANHLSEQAIAAGPDESDALAFRGRMLAMQNREQEAREMLRRATATNPRNAEAWFQLGSLDDRAKDHTGAVLAFRKATALRPADPRGWDYLGLHLEPLGKIEDAEAAYRKGLEVNQGALFDYFLDYNYGRLLLKRNRLTESKAHLDRALELVPQLRATHYDRAKLYLRLGEWDEARKDAESALAIPDPNNLILDLQLYNLLTAIYTRLGDREQERKYAALSESTKIPLRADRVR